LGNGNKKTKDLQFIYERASDYKDPTL